MYRNTQNNSNTIWPMERFSSYCIFVYIDCIKHNEINKHFWYAQNLKPIYYGMNIIDKCLQGHKTNSGILVTRAENLMECYFIKFLNKINLKNTMQCLRIQGKPKSFKYVPI